jgi:hypothetical protein
MGAGDKRTSRSKHPEVLGARGIGLTLYRSFAVRAPRKHTCAKPLAIVHQSHDQKAGHDAK